jgi:hypothetical protein
MEIIAPIYGFGNMFFASCTMRILRRGFLGGYFLPVYFKISYFLVDKETVWSRMKLKKIFPNIKKRKIIFPNQQEGAL